MHNLKTFPAAIIFLMSMIAFADAMDPKQIEAHIRSIAKTIGTQNYESTMQALSLKLKAQKLGLVNKDLMDDPAEEYDDLLPPNSKLVHVSTKKHLHEVYVCTDALSDRLESIAKTSADLIHKDQKFFRFMKDLMEIFVRNAPKLNKNDPALDSPEKAEAAQLQFFNGLLETEANKNIENETVRVDYKKRAAALFIAEQERSNLKKKLEKECVEISVLAVAKRFYSKDAKELTIRRDDSVSIELASKEAVFDTVLYEKDSQQSWNLTPCLGFVQRTCQNTEQDRYACLLGNIFQADVACRQAAGVKIAPPAPGSTPKPLDPANVPLWAPAI